MRKFWAVFFPVIIVLLVMVILRVVDHTDEGAPFVHSTTGRRGASLFFDTLRHMNYPVAVSRNPLTLDTNTNHAYIIIQPAFPPSIYELEEMLDWVRSGGRLIYMHHFAELLFTGLLADRGIAFGKVYVHELGGGVLITGRTNQITNYSLMNNPETGIYLHAILSRWNVERIMFGEYYHRPSSGDNFFTRFPLIVRLVFVQMGIVALFAVWHLGKRFGNTIPYYEESEREENEHVHAVTRLYLKIKRRK